ncbi:MAG TPA: YbhB/YbcL family Raf kinase inhibitor-like protein [Solirubrobacteraceae bacterium]|jgi:hypothetical protein|nr:YbhB/YbcL family Raf kinase inhibitor-like protein [Solirubrobacteraceae bacterium]
MMTPALSGRVATIALGAAIALGATIALGGCGGSSHGGSAPGAPTTPAGSRAGVSAAGSTAPTSPPAGLNLSSPALTPGARIPARFTCTGADVSPPLVWSSTPRGTREVVVTMVDLDAPQPPFVHWALAGLSPRVHLLAAGASAPGSVPGANGFGGVGYRGPCPPPGDRPHRYRIEVFALRGGIGLRRGFALGAVRPTLLARTIAHGELQGTFSR